jgi:hypothetical protein
MGGQVNDDMPDPADPVVPLVSGPDTSPAPVASPEEPPVHRPLLERLGMASIALVLAVLFGAVAGASWVGGELFLAIMAGIGALMTAWAGLITITRG